MINVLNFLLEVVGLPFWISVGNVVSVFRCTANRSICFTIGMLKPFIKFYRGDKMSKIRQLMGEAFKAGNVNCCDSEEECVNEILAKHGNDGSEPIVEEESRIYASGELKQFPEGTRFQHSVLGECTVAQRKDTKYMAFADIGLGVAGFKSDGYPWDQPMKRL
jgi:hypothetical protein